LVFCPVRAQPAAPNPVTEINSEQLIAEEVGHGGLVVQVGCRDATLMVSLAEAPNVLVQGLIRDRDRLQDVRDQIRGAGLYGRVSAVPWEAPFLPYADSMVNLLLVTDERAGLERNEIDRVLTPLGVAWIERGGVLTSYRKGWPNDVDQWTHARYDAAGNAVSRDKRVGPRGSPLTSQAALEGEAAASLLAISPADGRVLAEIALPIAPAWDGMVAAQGSLYLALTDGQIVCLSSADSTRPKG
jgi:hypothetical protein